MQATYTFHSVWGTYMHGHANGRDCRIRNEEQLEHLLTFKCVSDSCDPVSACAEYSVSGL